MSTQKFKKGFTLIELMVVIVIIGILAAIAIPKLFGMSAKAKASEVGPAASTYIKLQQAYTIETGADPGDAKAIGYSLPGTRDASDNNKSKTSNFDYEVASTGGNGTWTAKAGSWANTACNDAAPTDWKITFPKSGGAVTPANGCAALTPNFDKLANN